MAYLKFYLIRPCLDYFVFDKTDMDIFIVDDSAEESNSTSVLATLAALAEATAQNTTTSKWTYYKNIGFCQDIEQSLLVRQ